MNHIRKMPLSVRMGLLSVLATLTAAAVLVLPGVFSSRASVNPAMALQSLDKEAMSARLNQLQDEIDSLKPRAVGIRGGTVALQLDAKVAEYEALSVQMGGDRATPRSTAPAIPITEKDINHAEMAELENTINGLKQQISADPANQGLRQQLDDAITQLKSMSDSMGGDLPVRQGGPAPRIVAPTPAGCTPTTTPFTNNTPVAIPTGPAVVTSTLNVAGVGTFLWDLDLTTFMPHTFAADLDITIMSPAGTIVTLTTDNGAGNDNVFNGTLWDDQATTAVSDFIFANNVVAAALQPEEAMGAFYGEDPNGTWTITISDDLAGDGGSLDTWTLGVTTLSSPPTETTATFSNNTPTPINDVATVASMINVAGAGTTVSKITMTTNLTHTFAADLDITLTSPSGRVVTITTDNGAGNDDVFNGTLWDDAGNPAGQVPYVTNAGMVTDHPYVNLTLASPLVVEGALAAFQGEDPNGMWTISITDDLAGDTGTLTSWSLDITTAVCDTGSGPCVCTTQTFTNNTPVAIPTGPAVVTSTLNVAGAGPVIFDLNLTTFLTHTFAADLDITISSPAGTVVTLTTDNGAGNDDVFNGTLWDDAGNPAGQVPYVTNAGMVTDHPYVNLTLASPLVPEEALAAFNGEDPNGTWTITISDDLAGDGGSLNSWTLDICTLPAAPIETTTPFTNNTPVAIPTGPAVVTSTLNVAGAGTQLGKVTLQTNLTHTFAADLDITLMSPAGTVVTLTTDNGAGNDDVFNGTLWDDAGNPAGQVPYVTNAGMVTDHPYVNLTLASPLVPEEALAAFNGEDPNGTWTITISDDLAGDGGSLNSWTLNITTIACPTECTLTIECPTAVTGTTSTTGGATGVVTFDDPVVGGDCVDPEVICTPPSGSMFPAGVTTVTCTATHPDAAEPAVCSFTVSVFDVCLQDDSNPNIVLLFNSATRQFMFCCPAVGPAPVTGIGTVTRKGNTISINATVSGMKLNATVSVNKGEATLRSGSTIRCTIRDTNTTNNTCSCAAAPPPMSATQK